MDRRLPKLKISDLLLRTLCVAFVLLAVHSGLSQPPSADPNAKTAPDTHPAEPRAVSDSAAVEERRTADHVLEMIVRVRAARTTPEVCASASAMLGANAKRVDSKTSRRSSQVARRLGAEFGATPQAVSAERSRLGVSWGDYVIAQTLSANTDPRIPTEQLIALHRGGLDWGQVAAGLEFDLADAVAAVQAETRVATGAAPADCRVALIRKATPRPSPSTISAAL
jgi:hypothetical protein